MDLTSICYVMTLLFVVFILDETVLASNNLKNELENQQKEINLIQLDIDEIKTLIAKIGDQTIKIQRLPLQDGSDFNITLNKMPGTNMDDLSEIEMNMEFRNEEDLPEIIQSHLKIGKDLSDAIYKVLRHMVTDKEKEDMHKSGSIVSQWGPWTKWGTCTAMCGNGFQYRQRQCITVEYMKCNGSYEQTKPCHNEKGCTVLNKSEASGDNSVSDKTEETTDWNEQISKKGSISEKTTTQPSSIIKQIKNEMVQDKFKTLTTTAKEKSTTASTVKPYATKHTTPTVTSTTSRINNTTDSTAQTGSHHLFHDDNKGVRNPGFWSECSVTCGKGLRSRWILNEQGNDVHETESCFSSSCNTANREASVAVDEGGFAKLHCMLHGQDGVPKWASPKGKFLEGNSRFKVDKSYLYIVHTSKADKGTYHCLVLDKDGRIKTADANLNVRSCADQACNNHGNCIELGYTRSEFYEHFICKCDMGYSGKHCEIGILSISDSAKTIIIVLLTINILGILIACVAFAIHRALRKSKLQKITDGHPELPKSVMGDGSSSEDSDTDSDENDKDLPHLSAGPKDKNQSLQSPLEKRNVGPGIAQRIMGTRVSSLGRFDQPNQFFSGMDNYYSCSSQIKPGMHTHQEENLGAPSGLTNYYSCISDTAAIPKQTNMDERSRNNNAIGNLPPASYSSRFNPFNTNGFNPQDDANFRAGKSHSNNPNNSLSGVETFDTAVNNGYASQNTIDNGMVYEQIDSNTNYSNNRQLEESDYIQQQQRQQFGSKVILYDTGDSNQMPYEQSNIDIESSFENEKQNDLIDLMKGVNTDDSTGELTQLIAQTNSLLKNRPSKNLRSRVSNSGNVDLDQLQRVNYKK